MKFAVLGNAGSWYVEDLRTHAAQAGHQMVRLNFSQLISELHTVKPAEQFTTAAECLTETTSQSDRRERTIRRFESKSRSAFNDQLNLLHDVNAIIVRTMPPGSLEQVVFRMDLLSALEARGMMVINPSKAIECAVDKYLTTSKLVRKGLKVPRTIVCESADVAMQAFEMLGEDVIVKPLFGAEGRGIVRLTEKEIAWRTFRTLSRLQTVLYLQETIHHKGYDIRVLVLDGAIIGSMKRFAREGEFRTNVSCKGKTAPHQVTSREAELAIEASRITGAVFAGIDLLPDRQGSLHVLEVNAVPGWKRLEKQIGIQIAPILLNWIENRLHQEDHQAEPDLR